MIKIKGNPTQVRDHQTHTVHVLRYSQDVYNLGSDIELNFVKMPFQTNLCRHLNRFTDVVSPAAFSSGT